jgi:hypothetical protein
MKLLLTVNTQDHPCAPHQGRNGTCPLTLMEQQNVTVDMALVRTEI